MSKAKYSKEFKLAVVQDYLSGKGSIASLAEKNGVGKKSLSDWVRQYSEHGAEAFTPQSGYRSYSQEFKLKCVKAVMSGEGSVDDIVVKYRISSRSVLNKWISKYNAHKELKDYDPKKETSMAGNRRKTTLNERIEIVKYCIEHDRNYKDTARFYNVSYDQVYSWVKKYDLNGEEALTDKRGHHKSDEELSEIERLRRENERLKRQLKEQDMVVELLKKVKEFERM